jgi:hypothetical protein
MQTCIDLIIVARANHEAACFLQQTPSTYLIELDVKKPLVVFLQERSEKLRLQRGLELDKYKIPA